MSVTLPAVGPPALLNSTSRRPKRSAAESMTRRTSASHRDVLMLVDDVFAEPVGERCAFVARAARDHDVGALRREEFGGRFADAAGSAGDYGDLATQAISHRFVLPSLFRWARTIAFIRAPFSQSVADIAAASDCVRQKPLSINEL